MGDTLGDGDDELDLILDSLDDCVRGERGWDVDDRSVGLGVLDSVGDGSEDGETEVLSAGFLHVSKERVSWCSLLGWFRQSSLFHSR